MGLDRRIDAREGAHRPRYGAGRDLAARRLQPLCRAGELGVVAGELEAEARGLGVDPVAAADAERALVLQRAALQRGRHGIDAAGQQGAGAIELHREAGVEHVRRGKPLVDEARLRPHVVREVGEEGDHVVAGLALDRVDFLGVDERVGVRAHGMRERVRRLPAAPGRARPGRRARGARSPARWRSGSPAPRPRPSPGVNNAGSWDIAAGDRPSPQVPAAGLGWGARIRTWDHGTKTRCLTAWLRPRRGGF